MERLTYRSPVFNNPVSNGACLDVRCNGKCNKCKIEEIISKLCAYEDAGLTPEEIMALQASFKELKKEAVPLMKAKIEERLLVLPCKPGTEIFGHCHIRNAQPISHSIFYPPYVPTLGVDVWLTREEAEAALKEQEG